MKAHPIVLEGQTTPGLARHQETEADDQATRQQDTDPHSRKPEARNDRAKRGDQSKERQRPVQAYPEWFPQPNAMWNGQAPESEGPPPLRARRKRDVTRGSAHTIKNAATGPSRSGDAPSPIATSTAASARKLGATKMT